MLNLILFHCVFVNFAIKFKIYWAKIDFTIRKTTINSKQNWNKIERLCQLLLTQPRFPEWIFSFYILVCQTS